MNIKDNKNDEFYNNFPGPGSSYKEVINKGALIIKENTSSYIPYREAEILAEYVLNLKREKLYINFLEPFPPDFLNLYYKKIKERAEGMPLAYITGTQEFMSLEFFVTPSVLIPRPETEFLVEAVIDWANKNKPARPVILDMGTGSGNIALAIARYLPSSIIYASDISPEALVVAKKNAEKLGISEQISFLEGDLFFPLEGQNVLFDVILSNPPYLTSDDMNNLDTCVAFEPELALFGRNDGMFFYREIINIAPRYLNPKGLLAFEAGAGQADDISLLLRKKNGKNIRIIKDLASIDRVVMAEF